MKDQNKLATALFLLLFLLVFYGCDGGGNGGTPFPSDPPGPVPTSPTPTTPVSTNTSTSTPTPETPTSTPTIPPFTGEIVVSSYQEAAPTPPAEATAEVTVTQEVTSALVAKSVHYDDGSIEVNSPTLSCGDVDVVGWFPTWSPNGQHMACVSAGDEGKEQLIFNQDNEDPYTTEDTIHDLTWNDTSDTIAFLIATDTDTTTLSIRWKKNKSGGQLLNLTSSYGASYLSWYGEHIAVASQQGTFLHKVKADTTEPSITERRRISHIPSCAVAWSPDGSHLAFTSTFNGKQGIYTVRPDGKERKRLSVQSSCAVAWSPDGDWLAYLTNDENPVLWITKANPDNSVRVWEWCIPIDVGGSLITQHKLSLSWRSTLTPTSQP